MLTAPLATVLSGSVVVGATSFEVSLNLPSPNGNMEFHGQTTSPLNFTEMIGDWLGASFLELPEGFPEVVFNAVEIAFVPGQSVDLAASSTVSWSRPFGVLDGLGLSDFSFWFRSSGSQNSTLAFEAQATYGDFLELKGQILFSGGKLVLVAITIANEFSVSQFLSWSVPTLNWGDLLPVTFRPESTNQPIRLYYALVAYQGYSAGFRLDQIVIDVLGYGASIGLAVSPEKEVSFSGSLDQSIDLEFLKIEGPDFQGNSPAVQVVCGPKEKAFKLVGGVRFLDEAFGSFEIGVEKAPSQAGFQLRATIGYKGDIGPFQNPRFTFTWSKQRGFAVEEWPIPNFSGSEVLDFVKLLNSVPSGGCAAFVKDMFKGAIDSTFNFKAAMGQPESSSAVGASLNVTLSGTYALSLKGQSPFLTVPLPADLHVSLTKPEEFNFESLGNALLNAIEGAALDLVEQIVNVPERSAAFFAAVVAPAALAQVISMLACRGWGRPPLPAPSPPPKNPPKIPSTPKNLPPPPSGGPGSPGATSLGSLGFLGKGLAAGWGIAVGALTSTAVIQGSLDGEDVDNLLVSLDLKDSEAILPVSEDWPAGQYAVNIQGVNSDGVGAWSNQFIIDRLAPLSKPNFSVVGLSITIQWQPVSWADQYGCRIYSPLGDLWSDSTTVNTSVKLKFSTTDPSGDYRIQVRAMTISGTAIPSQWSSEAMAFVDTAPSDGWTVMFKNDLPANVPDTRLAVTVTDPPEGEPIIFLAGESGPVGPVPLLGFTVLRQAQSGGAAKLTLYDLKAESSGGEISVAYSQLANDQPPADFALSSRLGLWTASSGHLWADSVTALEMAQAVLPSVPGVVDLVPLLMFAYPPTEIDALGSILSSAGFPAADVALGLLSTNQATTPSTVAVALVAGFNAIGQPLDETSAARALMSAYLERSIHLAAHQLVTALFAAIPASPPYDVATLQPKVMALRNVAFQVDVCATAFVAAISSLRPSALAGALKIVYLGPTATLAQYAESLSLAGYTAVEAATRLGVEYDGASAQDFAFMFFDVFPDTAGTPLLLAWALRLASVSLLPAAAANHVVLPGASITVLAEALKAAYPAPEVVSYALGLMSAGDTGVEAAPLLATRFSDLTATQLALVLLLYFPSSVNGPGDVANGVHAAGFSMNVTAIALHDLFPRLTIADLATILKTVFLASK